MSNIEQRIFKQGSSTYYWSSLFFPKSVRDDVFKLYSFVRVADDYVDAMPQRAAEFRALRAAWETAVQAPTFDTTAQQTDSVNERVVKNIVAVTRKYKFDPAWIMTFLDAMESDLTTVAYQTLDDTLRYTYGSSEVIGLMMSKIMGLPPAAYEAARMQGRAMQWINFIRDIAEDSAMGRQYFPQEDLQNFGLEDLQEQTARKNATAFRAFIQFQIERYQSWQTAAEAGYRYIPRRLLLPLRTAADMYAWTADQISKDALMVFKSKVKPAKPRIAMRAIRNRFVPFRPT